MVTGIKGKVAAILDQYTLVLNIGSENGVKKGLKFVIYELGDSIKDPETETELGSLEIVKGFAEVVNVQEKLCTVRSSEEQTEYLSPIWTVSKQITKRVSLPVLGSTVDISNRVKIKVGDLVRQTW